MQAITIAMIVYVVICAALVFAVSAYEDIKCRHELHRERKADPTRPASDTSLPLETREVKSPHNAPRTRHAA